MKQQCYKSILPNGVRVLSEYIPNVCSVSVGIWVTVGSRNERPKDLGISHFIEHMIFKGTEQRSALDIAKAFDQMGGFSNAFTSKETTCFYAKVLDSQLDRVLELLSDILLRSRFDKIEVERERQVILQEIGMLEDSPDEFIHEVFSKFYWSGNGLGRSVLGTVENVQAIGPQDLKDYVHKNYVGPNILIAAAGNLKHESFVAKVGRLFGEISPESSCLSHSMPVPHLGVQFVHRDLEQLHILMGYKGPSSPDPKRYHAILLNVILGGSMSSRLFQEIREKRGLAYSVYSFLSSFQDTGILGIYAGTSPSEASTVTELMQKELVKLADQSPGHAELEAARDHIKGGLFLSAENTESRMTRLTNNEITLGRSVSYDEMIRSLDAVTPDDIQQMARDCLENGAAMVCLGPIRDKEAKKCKTLVSGK
ncbi:MAG: insulinase family protein [Nitrospiraceae bacterium]|nr:insulinase family protein [Nitrospiraceae bacterium]